MAFRDKQAKNFAKKRIVGKKNIIFCENTYTFWKYNRVLCCKIGGPCRSTPVFHQNRRAPKFTPPPEKAEGALRKVIRETPPGGGVSFDRIECELKLGASRGVLTVLEEGT